MSEYEEAAYASLKQLEEENTNEINQLRSKIVSDYPIVGKPINKKIIEYKTKEKALMMLKKYDAAERMKRKREALEETDMNNFIRQDIQRLVEKEELKLRAKHDAAMEALIKRIQRDRNEQLLHRQVDSKQLIQRNKNLIQGFMKRQVLESKKTKEFLNYLFGMRGPANKINSSMNSGNSTKKPKKIKHIKQIDTLPVNKNQPNSFFITDRENNHYSDNMTKGLKK